LSEALERGNRPLFRALPQHFRTADNRRSVKLRDFLREWILFRASLWATFKCVHDKYRYAGPPASADSTDSDREDPHPEFLEVEHHDIATDLYLHTVGTPSRSLKDLNPQLDDAVAAVGAAGVSWDKIGRAYAISRHGA